MPPRERGDILRRAYDLIMRAPGRPRAADDARDGQARRRVQGRDRLRRQLLPLVRRGGGAHQRPLHDQRERQGPRADDEAADRPVRVHHAVELPAGDGHAQDRARRSPPAARWSSSRPSRRRCRCSRWRRSSRRPGCPAACCNVITAKSSGAVMEPLIKDPRTRKLSFTGSTEVGRELIKQSADQILKVSMELGGNAPFLVFEDADLDLAVEGAMLAKMRNIGEACTSANRFHVARVRRRRVRRAARRADGRAAGRPRHRGRRAGRAADRRHAARQGRGARRGRAFQGREGRRRRRAQRRRRLLLQADRAGRHPRRRARAERGDLRAGRAGQGLRSPRRRRSRPPTTPSTASSPTSSRATSTARSASWRSSTPG